MSIAPLTKSDSSADPVAIISPDRHTKQATPGTHPRVLHVINGEHYSGAERVQDLLAARLPETGYDVAFACIKPGRFPEVRQSTEAPLYLTPMHSKLDLRIVQRLVRIIRQESYELVHAHTPRSALIGRAASALARVPLVYHVHSPTSRDSTHRWRNRVNRWLERASLVRTAALITVSDSLRRDMLAQGYGDSRVFTVANGVPVPSLKRSDMPPGPVWTLGMVALFRPRKGVEVLLEAMASLRQLRFPVKLRAVGPFETPGYEAEVRQRVQELHLEDVVQWTGFTSNIAAELAQLDAFVLPSLFGEGLPMVVLEAMAAGVPVVATRVEGVPEAIEDGVSGLVADPSSGDDLARCIARLVRGEVVWHQLRQRAMQRHAEKFSDRIMAQRVAEVYRRVLGS
jgi:glycosyltransferase involved in cell wall biosynthesis